MHYLAEELIGYFDCGKRAFERDKVSVLAKVINHDKDGIKLVLTWKPLNKIH